MNIGIMYLIQRKADGFYYRNRTGGYGSPAWSDKVDDCRPFKTKGGAKTSRGWNDWKTTITPDACDLCKNSKYGSRYEHTFSERYNNSRWTKTKDTVQQWTEKNGQKPCFIITRMAEKENPNKVITVTLSID